MPAPITAEYFLERYSEFAEFDPEHVQEELDLVERVHCPASVWHTVQPDGTPDNHRQIHAIMLRTAHNLELRRVQIARTASVGESAAQGKVALPSPITGDGLDQTTYGVAFRELRRTITTAAFAF